MVRDGQEDQKWTERGSGQGWSDPGEMVKDGPKWSKGREAVRERRRGQTCQRQLDMGQLVRMMGVGRGHQREERQPEMLEMIREHQ